MHARRLAAPVRRLPCGVTSPVTLVLDYLQGVRARPRRRRAAVPAGLVAGALATADARRRLRRHGLRVPRAALVARSRWRRRSCCPSSLRARLETPPGRRPWPASPSAWAALLGAGTLDDRLRPGGRAWSSGSRAPCWPAPADPRPARRAPRARLDAQARAALPRLRRGRRRLLVALVAVLLPPLALVVAGFFAWLLAGGRRREGEKYAGLRILRVSVRTWREASSWRSIDGLKPSMLQRAVASGRAPALAAVLERGTSTEACASFPSVTPVCAASIATGARQDRHHIPAMNWFHRAEGRYVEYGSSFSAARRFGVVQQLTDTVFNMNAEHLPADCETVFESLDDVDVRTAGTTYLMYRGRHEHELSRSSAITRLASPGGAPDGHGPARALLRRPLRQPRHGLPRPVRPAGRARPAHGLRRLLPRRARPLRLPAVLAAGQRHALARARPARPGRVDRDRRPPARAPLPRRRGHGRASSTSGRSSSWPTTPTPRSSAASTCSTRSRTGTSCRRTAPGATRPSSRSARAARRDGLRARPRGAARTRSPRVVASARALEGVDLALWRPAPREGAIASARAELRFSPGRGPARSARAALVGRGRPRRARPRRRATAC